MNKKPKVVPVGFLAKIVAIAKANSSLTRDQVRNSGVWSFWFWSDPRQDVHKYRNDLSRQGIPKKQKKGSKKPH